MVCPSITVESWSSYETVHQLARYDIESEEESGLFFSLFLFLWHQATISTYSSLSHKCLIVTANNLKTWVIRIASFSVLSPRMPLFSRFTVNPQVPTDQNEISPGNINPYFVAQVMSMRMYRMIIVEQFFLIMNSILLTSTIRRTVERIPISASGPNVGIKKRIETWSSTRW